VNRIIDLWADQATTDQGEKVELARLDELQETFYARALEGDVQYGALVTKIIERRSVMLGLDTPQTAVLQIVNEAAQETSPTRSSARSTRCSKTKGKRTTRRRLVTLNRFLPRFPSAACPRRALLRWQEVALAGKPTPLLPELRDGGARHLGLQRARTSTRHCGSMLLKPPPAPRLK
jgi:hypothetical protein